MLMRMQNRWGAAGAALVLGLGALVLLYEVALIGMWLSDRTRKKATGDADRLSEASPEIREDGSAA